MEQINPTDLQPHPRNAAIYGSEDITELLDRVRESAWVKPLVVTQQNVIISGHRRQRVALALGMASVPVERRAFASEHEELEALLLENQYREKTIEQKVREAELWREVEAERARARMFAGVTLDPVVKLPQGQEAGKTRDIVAAKVGMKGSSYERAAKVVETADKKRAEGKAQEADQLLHMLNTESVNRAFSEVKKEERQEARAATPAPVIPVGFTVDHRNDIKHIGDGSIDFILTDPPYGISKNGGATKVGGQIVSTNFDGDDSAWDSDSQEEYLCKLDLWAAEWARVLRPGGAVVSFTDKAMISHLWDACRRHGLGSKNIITWVKVNPSPAGLARNSLISATEFMIWATKPGAGYTFNRAAEWDMRNVIITPIVGGNEKTDHPTQKPLKILSPLIEAFSNPGDLILDPFAGSGSTGVAALRLGRRARLIEQSADYVRIAQERLAA